MPRQRVYLTVEQVRSKPNEVLSDSLDPSGCPLPLSIFTDVSCIFYRHHSSILTGKVIDEAIADTFSGTTHIQESLLWILSRIPTLNSQPEFQDVKVPMPTRSVDIALRAVFCRHNAYDHNSCWTDPYRTARSIHTIFVFCSPTVYSCRSTNRPSPAAPSVLTKRQSRFCMRGVAHTSV